MKSPVLITQSHYRRLPWKNGLGVTAEIAIHPDHASLERGDFLWRLSSARINEAAPFSEFPLHDRTLVILEGSGVRLFHTHTTGEAPKVVEIGPLDPYDFPGDIPTRCELLSGPVRDLSIFVRKGEAIATTEVRRIEPDTEWAWIPTGQSNFMFAAQGDFVLSVPGQNQKTTIAQGDTLALRSDAPLIPDERLRIRSVTGAGTIVLVAIHLL